MIDRLPIVPADGLFLDVLDEFSADHAQAFAEIFAGTWQRIPAADRAVVLTSTGERGVRAELAIFTNDHRLDMAHASIADKCLRFSTFQMQWLPDELVGVVFAHETAHLLDYAERPTAGTMPTMEAAWHEANDREHAAIEAVQRWGLEPLWCSTWLRPRLLDAIDRALPPLEPEPWPVLKLAGGEAEPEPRQPATTERDFPPHPRHPALQRWAGMHPRCLEYWELIYTNWRQQRAAAIE